MCIKKKRNLLKRNKKKNTKEIYIYIYIDEGRSCYVRKWERKKERKKGERGRKKRRERKKGEGEREKKRKRKKREKVYSKDSKKP